MIGRDIYLEHPIGAILIPFAVLLIGLMFALANYRQNKISLYLSPSLESKLLFPRSKTLSLIKNTALILAWIFGCLALMGPKGNLSYSSLTEKTNSISKLPQRKPHDIIFMVDTSASMNVPDGRNGETRLDEGKEIMDEIVSLLDGQNVGLNVFTSEMSTIVPPTIDYLFMRLTIREISINEGYTEGTNMEKAFLTLREKTFRKPSSKLYTVIFLSDGGDNALENLQGEERKKRMFSILNTLPNMQEFNYQLFTVGLGSLKGGIIPYVTDQGKPVTSKLEQDILKDLAKKGKGHYYQANEKNAWDLAQSIMHQIEKRNSYETADPSAKERTVLSHDDSHYDLYFQIPLGLALCLLVLAYILPESRKIED